jgi:hypothetical protein
VEPAIAISGKSIKQIPSHHHQPVGKEIGETAPVRARDFGPLYGSLGLVVGANQVLPDQNSTNEFSLFFGQVSHGSLLVHGFVTL